MQVKRNAIMKKVLLTLLPVLIFALNGSACTTFFLKNNDGKMIFGRNFDFPAGQGHIQINQRGVKKSSFIAPPEKLFQWISEYGSISFNQNGREFPYGGMNEAGLVIEQMWLEESVYPEYDERNALTELQWIQYQLDKAGSVEEVIASDKYLRISFTSVAKLHFLVADASGNSAVIEYLNGRMSVKTGDSLPYSVLANSCYSTSLDYKKQKETGAEVTYSPMEENSSGRFLTAARMITGDIPRGTYLINYGFSILDAVAQGPATQWSIIYDLTDRNIYYRTHQNTEIRRIDFNSFQYNCSVNHLFMDIDRFENAAEYFSPLDFPENYNLINSVCNDVEFLSNIPGEHRKAMAGVFLDSVCAE